MTTNIETLSINQFAKRFLKLAESDSFPKKLHDVLQNVFTKGHRKGESHPERAQYRQKVIFIHSSGAHNQKHAVIEGRSYTIYNALVLFYLVGTSQTQKFFQHYYLTQNEPEKRDFSVLHQQSTQQYLEYFCLGVVQENIDQIEACLLAKDFDLFTQRLPSPFSVDLTTSYDLTPMVKLYDQSIPWKDYMAKYQQAELHFENKEFEQARRRLVELKQEAIIRLPAIEALNRKMDAELKEADEAWDYLQTLLNENKVN